MRGRLESWLLFCPACGLWRSTLGSEDRLQESQALDESRRVSGLASLRDENYRRTLDAVRRLGPVEGKRLLDVGCAYGWFLKAAGDAGMVPAGLEPDPGIAAAAAGDGFQVWVGYFPDAVPPGETFDVIAFNDVLEHIHDLDAVLSACRRLLRPGGLLVISSPDSRGFLFRVSGPLARIGRKDLLHRLWQKGYPSPHLSYFNPGNLARLMRRHGFEPRVESPLRSLRMRGLWSRLHMDRRPSPLSLASYLALVAVLPVLIHLLPSDQLLGVYARLP
ncbi:MAG TPA: class I SAM-dependent methyltransferase [Thermoanaerobaculia bacterium]